MKNTAFAYLKTHKWSFQHLYSSLQKLFWYADLLLKKHFILLYMLKTVELLNIFVETMTKWTNALIWPTQTLRSTSLWIGNPSAQDNCLCQSISNGCKLINNTYKCFKKYVLMIKTQQWKDPWTVFVPKSVCATLKHFGVITWNSVVNLPALKCTVSDFPKSPMFSWHQMEQHRGEH